MAKIFLYYNNNRISVPIYDMGDLTNKGSQYDAFSLRLTQQAGGGQVVCNCGEPPVSAPSDTQIINTSNTPLLPQIGSSYYLSFTNETHGALAYHDYRANGGHYAHINNLNSIDNKANKVFLATAIISGKKHLGFAIINDYSTGWGFPKPHSWCFYYDNNSNSSLDKIYQLATTSPDPGEKGFRPIGNIAKNTTGGGSESGLTPTYFTDILTQPGEPDETHGSAIGTGFVNIYKVDEANLARLGKCLFNGLFAKLNNLFIAPMDYIVSLQVFPYQPHLGATEYIKVLQYTAISADLSEDSQGTKLSKQFRTVDCGTLTVAEMWESFLDYDATSFSLYLPFIGTVDIDVSEVMNGSINVQYTIDYLTGMCVANVLCTKNVPLPDGSTVPQYAYHSYQGNCAVTIPLCNESFGNIVGSLATAAAACFTGGIGAAAGALASSAASGGFKPSIETKGAISSNAGFCSILHPYITIRRPITVEPENYQEVMGYPSYVDAVLGTCQGFCVCDNIELSNLAGATDSEIERIKQMCRDGIII